MTSGWTLWSMSLFLALGWQSHADSELESSLVYRVLDKSGLHTLCVKKKKDFFESETIFLLFKMEARAYNIIMAYLI